MYKVTQTYCGRVIVTRKPPYARAGGGRFELDKCSQRDLRYLYEALAMTNVVESVEEEKPETASDEVQQEHTTKQPGRQRGRRTDAKE